MSRSRVADVPGSIGPVVFGVGWVVRQCPLPSDDMAEVRCRPQISHGRVGAIALPLKRGCETVKVCSAWPAPQMHRQLRCRELPSPTCPSPFMTGHQWPSGRRDAGPLLWRQRAPQFTGKWRQPTRQLPITGFAHNATNGRRPLLAAIGTAPKYQGAAAREWLAARKADLLPVGYFHVVFTLPPRSPTSPFTTRRRFTTCCSGWRPRPCSPSPRIPVISVRASVSPPSSIRTCYRGRSRLHWDHPNADIRPNLATTAQMTAAGGKRTLYAIEPIVIVTSCRSPPNGWVGWKASTGPMTASKAAGCTCLLGGYFASSTRQSSPRAAADSRHRLSYDYCVSHDASASPDRRSARMPMRARRRLRLRKPPAPRSCPSTCRCVRLLSGSVPRRR